MTSVAIIVIGTEILRGKRQDAHFQRLRADIQDRGYEVAWLLYLPDQRDVLAEQLRWAFDRPEALFCFGGLGATPDDLTRAAAAEAAGLPLVRHTEAEAMIRAEFGAQAEPVRVRMADLPQGASLIPNPFNRVPGFSLGKHHFFPGFPEMAAPMSRWVLERQFPPRAALVEQRLVIEGVREGDLVPLMEAFCAAHPEVFFCSLPSFKGGTRVELGVAGEAQAVAVAYADLEARLKAAGQEFSPLPAHHR